jgi:hypothetical protein
MMEDAFQLFTGNLALVGVGLTIVGLWFAWPRQMISVNQRVIPVSLAQFQTLIGVVIAFLGVVLLIIGLAAHPVY